MKLRKLNAAGVEKFGAYLDDLALDGTLAPPMSLLEDAELTLEVPSAPQVARRRLSTRMEAAKLLDATLGSLKGLDVDRDIGLWSWLTLMFFDSVCPPDASGVRQVRDRSKYIPAVADFRKYYRHLLAGPYRVFRAHRSNPSRALVVLAGPIDKPGEVVEQIVARQEIITNPSAVAAATQIYIDASKGTLRRGAGGKGGGSARRFADILNQLDVTWDLYSMSPEEIVSRLPREFDRFKR